MGEIHWTPELVERVERNIASLEAEAASERCVADALREHADEHERRAYAAADQAQRYREALAAGEAALGEALASEGAGAQAQVVVV